MPVTWRYDREQRFIVAVLSNPLTEADIRAVLKQITSSGDFAPDIPALWDARDLDFAAINREFQDRIIEIRKAFPQRGPARTAVLVGNDLGFGMARMYQAISDELPRQIRVFRRIDDAGDWLSESRD